MDKGRRITQADIRELKAWLEANELPLHRGTIAHCAVGRFMQMLFGPGWWDYGRFSDYTEAAAHYGIDIEALQALEEGFEGWCNPQYAHLPEYDLGRELFEWELEREDMEVYA